MRNETELIEIFMTCAFWAFGISILIDPRMFTSDAYEHFMDRRHLIACFFVISMMCTYGLFVKTNKSRFFSGVSYLIGAFVWLMVSFQFWLSYPPLNTAMTVYPLMCIFCFIAGRDIINESRSL